MQTPCGERTVGTGPFSSCLCPVTDFQKGRRGQLEPETGEAELCLSGSHSPAKKLGWSMWHSFPYIQLAPQTTHSPEPCRLRQSRCLPSAAQGHRACPLGKTAPEHGSQVQWEDFPEHVHGGYPAVRSRLPWPVGDCCWQDFPTYTHRWWSPRYWVVDYCFFHSDHPQRKVYNFPIWRYGFCSLPNILWAFCLLSPPFLMMLKEPKSPNSELMGFIFKYLWSTISVPKVVHTHHCSHVWCWVYIRSVPLGQGSDKSYQ